MRARSCCSGPGGLWAALRFLSGERCVTYRLWSDVSALAYLTRPEGLLLPAAVVSALVLSPRWAARGLGKRGMVALGVLVVGSAALVGPYVVMRGGLGTKPSIARLLGTAPRSAAHAVERQRPLEPGQTEALTYLLAGKAVFKAITEAVTWPLLPFATLGLVRFGLAARDEARQWRLARGDRPGVGAGALAAARDGGLLQPEARDDPVDPGGPGRRVGAGLARGEAIRAVAGLGATAVVRSSRSKGRRPSRRSIRGSTAIGRPVTGWPNTRPRAPGWST